MEEFKIAVVSDLHCCYPKGNNFGNITYLSSNIMKKPILRNPVESLKKLITEEKIQVDILLCPGDIADKSDQQGLNTGWHFLEEIHEHIGSSHLFATLGNHDIDYTKSISKIFNDLPKRLSDNFPTSDGIANQRFWDENFCLIEKDDFIIFIYNSVFSFTDVDAAKKPFIDLTTLEKIEGSLKDYINSPKYKIGMCHHHPLKHANMDYPDNDVIDSGDKLLEILNTNNFHLMIHGHKHDPRLNYMNSLPVLGAGAFSSLMNLSDIGAENVFHLITLFKNEKKGIIKTWVYGPQSGWRIKNDSYFPCYTGFGYNKLDELAENCAKWFEVQKNDIVFYSKLTEAFPDIQFLIPADQKKLNLIFKDKYKIELSPPLPNLPKTLNKMML